jgi:cyanophycinase-like exopeptidase
MKLSQIIDRLSEIKHYVGDQDIWIRDEMGVFRVDGIEISKRAERIPDDAIILEIV